MRSHSHITILDLQKAVACFEIALDFFVGI